MYVVRTNIWIYFLNIVVAIFQKILESKDYILRLQHEYIHQFILDVLCIYLDLISYSCCNFPNLTKRDLTTSSGNRCFSTKNASYVMFVKKIRGRYFRQTYNTHKDIYEKWYPGQSQIWFMILWNFYQRWRTRSSNTLLDTQVSLKTGS